MSSCVADNQEQRMHEIANVKMASAEAQSPSMGRA